MLVLAIGTGMLVANLREPAQIRTSYLRPGNLRIRSCGEYPLRGRADLPRVPETRERPYLPKPNRPPLFPLFFR